MFFKCTKEVFIINSVVITQDYNEDSLSSDSRLTLALFRVKCSNAVLPSHELRQTDTDHQSGYRYLCYWLGSWDELAFLVLTGNWLPSISDIVQPARIPRQRQLDSLQWSFPHLNKPSRLTQDFSVLYHNFHSESACGTLFNACKKKSSYWNWFHCSCLCVLFSIYFTYTYIGDSKSYNISPIALSLSPSINIY